LNTWRYNFRVDRNLNPELGKMPFLSLKDQGKIFRVHKSLHSRINPFVHKKMMKAIGSIQDGGAFEAVVDQWLHK
jgi:hypothetical protein